MIDPSDVRLTLARLEGKVDGINARLDKLNGSVERHERRLNDHDVNHAHSDGVDAGRADMTARISSRDKAVIAGIISVASIVTGVVVKLMAGGAP